MDTHYRDPFLVSIYDAVNGSRIDFDFYLGQFPKPPAKILDIGCGTGEFATELVAFGYSVIGVDPASEMIAAARAKKGAEAVDWIVGFASDVPPDARVDVAVMTGHAFQCLLRDDEISTLFRSVAACLKQDGSFWFETRNAGAQPWTKWVLEHARPTVTLIDGRTLRVVHNVLAVDGEYVTFEEAYQINDQAYPLTSRSTLRFPSFSQIEQMAGAHGLRIGAIFGDWTGGVFHERSPELIVRLKKVND